MSTAGEKIKTTQWALAEQEAAAYGNTESTLLKNYAKCFLFLYNDDKREKKWKKI